MSSDITSPNSAALVTAVAAAEEFASFALSEGTRTTYRKAYALFRERCEALGLVPLPCSEDSLCAVIGAMAADGLTAASLTVVLAAVGMAHRLAEQPDPTIATKARLIIKGVRNTRGTVKGRKQPLYALKRPGEAQSELDRVLDLMPPHGVFAKRDRALILVGFAGALRRSELCALEFSDIEETAQGLLIRIRRSKTDQAGEGAQVALPYGTQMKCPVDALKAWLEVLITAGANTGKVFRSITKDGVLSGSLHPDSVGRILKRRFGAAGLDAAAYSGHSLRSGFLTSAADNGATVWQLVTVSRHKDVKSLSSYVHRRVAFDTWAGKGIL
ncbi:MAG: site-specific integrase [Rhodospirillaceae bacterium]